MPFKFILKFLVVSLIKPDAHKKRGSKELKLSKTNLRYVEFRSSL